MRSGVASASTFSGLSNSGDQTKLLPRRLQLLEGSSCIADSMPAYPHFVLPGNGQPEACTATRGGSAKFRAPPRDRTRHAQKLLDQIRAVRDSADEQLAKSPAASNLHFIPGVFEGAPDHELAIDSLENKPAGIRVLNVRTEGQECPSDWCDSVKLPVY